MKSYEVLEKRPFTGYGRTFAWAVVKEGQVVKYEYMGDYDRVDSESEAVLEKQKRAKFAKLSKKEVADRINFERFMEYRHRTKGYLYDVAGRTGGTLYSGLIRKGKFIVKENKDVNMLP